MKISKKIFGTVIKTVIFAKKYTMEKEIITLLKSGTNIKLELSLDQLQILAHVLAEGKFSTPKENEEYLTKKQVMEILGVCDTTLYLWAKRQFLVPLRLGKKRLYKKTDIDKLLNL